ncbi:hypothetical protein ACLB1Q_18305 [Escherichia coli]
MEQVKTAFGFVILALPVFLLERVIGDIWGLRLWSALGVATLWLGLYRHLQAKRGWMRVVQIILLAAALVSVRPLGLGIWCDAYRANSDASQLYTNQNGR